MKPKFTVVLAHYNQMQLIKEAIYSILKQKYDRIELIITDDCSKYFNREEITKFIENNKKGNLENYFIIKNNENIGTVKTLNKAVRKATGDYILFFAADDKLYDENVLENFVNSFNETERIITAQSIMCDKNLDKHFEKYVNEKKALENNMKCSKELFEIMSENCIYSSGATAYDTNIIKKYNYFDEKYKLIEDWTFWLKILNAGEKIYYHNFSALLHRDGGVSHYNLNKKLPPHVIQYYKDLLNAYKYNVMPFINEMSENNKIKVITKYLFSLKIFSERSSEIQEEYYEERILFFDKYKIDEEKYRTSIEKANNHIKLTNFIKEDLKLKLIKPLKTNKILKFSFVENVLLCDIIHQFAKINNTIIFLILIFNIIPLYFLMKEIDSQDYIVNDALVLGSILTTSFTRFFDDPFVLIIMFAVVTIIIYYILYIIFNLRKEK